MPQCPDFASIPDKFVHDLKRSMELVGRKNISLTELATALKKWRRRQT